MVSIQRGAAVLSGMGRARSQGLSAAVPAGPAPFLCPAGWLELSVCYLIPILSLLPGVWAAGKKHSPLSHAPQHILMN